MVIIHTELTAQKNVKNIFWAGNLMYLENIAVNCGGRNTVIKPTYCKKNYHVLAFTKIGCDDSCPSNFNCLRVTLFEMGSHFVFLWLLGGE